MNDFRAHTRNRRALAWLLACVLGCGQLLGAAHAVLHERAFALANEPGKLSGAAVATAIEHAPTNDPFRHAPGSADCVLWAGTLGGDAAAADAPRLAIAVPVVPAIAAGEASVACTRLTRAFDARGPPAA